MVKKYNLTPERARIIRAGIKAKFRTSLHYKHATDYIKGPDFSQFWDEQMFVEHPLFQKAYSRTKVSKAYIKKRN